MASEAQILEEIAKEEAERDRLFLKSWKVAVNQIGPELFAVKSATVDAATHKDELRPDFKAIAEHVHKRIDNHHYFLFMVVSFFSFVEIEVIFSSAGIGFPRVIDLQLLDDTERMIIYSLVEYSDIEW